MDISKELLAEDIFEYRVKYFTAKFDFKNENADADKIIPSERLFTTLFTIIENYARHARFKDYSDNYKDDMKENAQDVILTRATRYDKFTGGSPLAYITTIVHNVFIAELNRRKLEMTAIEAMKNKTDEMKEYPKEKDYIKPAPKEWSGTDKRAYSKFQRSMMARGVELHQFSDGEMIKAFNAHREILGKCYHDPKIREELTSELNGQ